MKYIVIVVLFFSATRSFAQSVAVNTDGTTGDASALLDVKSSTRGVLFPRMNKTQKNSIASPATGLLVFQTGPDSTGFHYYNGSGWIWLEALENKVWKTAGNGGTDTAVNFIGTTDNMPLRFKQNNTAIAKWNSNNNTYFIGANAGRLNSAGNNIGIGEEVLSKNVLGTRNIALGDSSMAKNTFGSNNIAIGFYAGKEITSNGSVFIGSQAGQNTTSAFNNFIGMWSGINNVNGGNNNFMGYLSGQNNISGSGNTAIGDATMSFIRRGSFNSLLGYRSNIGDAFQDSVFNNSTAIGALALADTSNAMVLGSISGVNGATANVNVGIGTTKPQAPLHISRGNAGFTGSIPSNRGLVIEDDFNSYMQLLTPDARESGIIAGNASGIVKSGVFFTADSALQIRTGGNSNTDMHIDKLGRVGIGTVKPVSQLHVSMDTLPGAKYGSSTIAVFENGNAFGNSGIQLMNKSEGDFSIFSGTELTFSRSLISFNSDSSFSIGTGASIENFKVDKNGNVGINTSTPAAKVDVGGTFKLGLNGTVNTALIKGTVVIDLPSMVADNEQAITVAVAGVTTNGVVSVSPAADLPAGINILWARVSSAGNVRIRFRNVSATTQDPAAISYNIMVLQ